MVKCKEKCLQSVSAGIVGIAYYEKLLKKKTEKSVRNIDSIEFVCRDHLIIGQKSNLNANLEIDPQIEEMPTIDRWKSSYESNAMSAFAILFAIIWLITCKKKLKRSNYMSQNTVPMIFYMVESLSLSLSGVFLKFGLSSFSVVLHFFRHADTFRIYCAIYFKRSKCTVYGVRSSKNSCAQSKSFKIEVISKHMCSMYHCWDFMHGPCCCCCWFSS